MARMNMVNVETVLWIARLGTFSAAAEQMHTTQPAVSARVRELERTLGIRLFEKHGRRMQLTIEGRQFVEQIDPLMLEIQRTFGAFESPAAASGIVRIGIGDISMTWFGDLLKELFVLMPGVNYEIDVDIAAALLKKLEDGRIDIAINPGDIDHAELATESLGYSRVAWVMGRDRVARYLEGADKPSLAELLNCGPIWMIPRTSSFYQRQVAMLRAHGAHLRNVNTCTNMTALIQLLNYSAGVGFVAEVLIRDQLQRGELVPMPPELTPFDALYTIVYRRNTSDPIVMRIVRMAVERTNFRRAPRADGPRWEGINR